MRHSATPIRGWAKRVLLLALIAQLAVPFQIRGIELDDEEGTLMTEERRTTVSTSMPLPAPIDPERYIVGPGDLFTIQLWGRKEAVMNVAINAEGEMFVPSIGIIRNLVGVKLADAKKTILRKIASVYKDIRYDVFLAKPRTFIVYVAGFAQAPGEYPATALTRVSQLMEEVGGPNAVGSTRLVEVWRDGKLFAVVDFFRISRFGEVERDITLLDGDVIKVPPRGKRVMIHGAVRSPGGYEMLSDETLKDLIEVQGAGFDEGQVTRRDPIEIISRHQSEQLEVRRYTLDEATTQQIELFDRDKVHVPTYGRYQKVIRIQGAVRGPGTTQIDPTGTRAVARGQLEGPAPSEAAGAGGAEGQILEHYGVYAYVEGEPVSSAIFRAGGVTPYADTDNAFIRRPKGEGADEYETIPVNLTAILIEKDFSGDIEMKPGDFLIVPSLDNRVFVSGAVVQPGSIAYVPYYTARYYIGLAGGQTNRAALKRSVLIHRNGEEIKLDLDAVVQPGDTIYVKEKVFKFWQDHWEILTGAATLILSGFAVLYTINRD